ncbi:Fc.00g107630.m01.CDS01 [Cosmosporella sp. VM-42]
MLSELESKSLQIDQGIQNLANNKVLDIWKKMEHMRESTEEIKALQLAGNANHLLLSLPCARNAVFDSADEQKRGECLTVTQSGTLEAIQEWIEDPKAEIILWLNGMFGTGKSSIARTVAKALDGGRSFTGGHRLVHGTFLGASFFFSQDEATINTAKSLVTTAAKSLAERFPQLGHHVVEAISENLDIGTKALQQQIDHLLFKPLSKLTADSCLPARLVIIIDALDECEDLSEVELLLVQLERLGQLQNVQLQSLKACDGLFLGKIRKDESGVAVDDITKFLTHELARIVKVCGFLQDWLSKEDMEKLSNKADGLFIYASTACRFLDFDAFDDSFIDERLKQVLEDDTDANAPQFSIDLIYLKVLRFLGNGRPKYEEERIYAHCRQILGFIATVFEPLPSSSLGQLLPRPDEKRGLSRILAHLNSVMGIPPDLKMEALGSGNLQKGACSI